MQELRVEVEPRSPFRLPAHGGADGVLRHRGGVLARLLHVEGEPVVVRVAQPARDRVLLGARATHRAHSEIAIERMRFALGVDDDLAPFYAAFKRDPLIGRSIRARPHLRCQRRPLAFEALAWAICEQLIDFPRAAAIERALVWRYGRVCAQTGLRDVPGPDTIAGIAPAELQALDLAHKRALALIRCARDVAAGRIDLERDVEHGWRRLRAIPEIGSWTIAMLALHGQGRYDAIPAGDLNYLKAAGRLLSGGDPLARATEQEVLDLFEPYGEWKGLAGAHALGVISRLAPGAALRPAGTRSSSSLAPLAA